MKSIFFLVVLAACASNPATLSEQGREVQVLASKPATECTVMGKVVGENQQGSADLARNHARNLAAKLRANAIFITQEVPNGQTTQVFATAYQCE